MSSAINPSILAAAEEIEGGLSEIVVGAISFYQLAERAFAAAQKSRPASDNPRVEAALKAYIDTVDHLCTDERWSLGEKFDLAPWPDPLRFHDRLAAKMRRAMNAALEAADAASPSPWRSINEVPEDGTEAVVVDGDGYRFYATYEAYADDPEFTGWYDEFGERLHSLTLFHRLSPLPQEERS